MRITKLEKNKTNFLQTVVLAAFLALLLVSGCVVGSSKLADGSYIANVTMEGGSGRASIESPAQITVTDGQIYATIVWSSEYYDYMIVDDTTYPNESSEGNSSFTIPVAAFGETILVIGDTTAMSVPHEIEYTLCFELAEESQPDFETLELTGSMDLSYATQFSVDEYGVYDLITIVDGGRFLLVPEDAEIPCNLPEDVVVLKQPLDRTYLVSTSAMDLIRAVDSISNIRLSGTKESGWYIDEAVTAMEDGTMLYAGKYSAPDYELILKEGCNLAIENTMIYHNPEVKEKLEELGIPVLVERSSYEEHPLGRLEWVKLYGVLYGKKDEAESFYEEQLAKIEPIMEKEQTGKTVAFFYVIANGAVSVRKPSDYISKMIELAGGEYILNSLEVGEENENALSTMNMQMEDFYVSAKDADILIYNSTIDGEIESIDDLVEKNTLFSDFKAVQSGEVYCTSSNFFQKSTGTSDFMEDLNKVVTGEQEEFTFLKKLR